MTDQTSSSITHSTVDTSDPPYLCKTCNRRFKTQALLIHHCGVRHPDTLDEGEKEQLSELYQEEEAQLRRFRIIALGGIVLLYFGFFFMYAIFAV